MRFRTFCLRATWLVQYWRPGFQDLIKEFGGIWRIPKIDKLGIYDDEGEFELCEIREIEFAVPDVVGQRFAEFGFGAGEDVGKICLSADDVDVEVVSAGKFWIFCFLGEEVEEFLQCFVVVLKGDKETFRSFVLAVFLNFDSEVGEDTHVSWAAAEPGEEEIRMAFLRDLEDFASVVNDLEFDDVIS